MFAKTRIVNTAKIAILETLNTPDKSPFLRLVRWRKRRWEPVNQAKLFHVPERKPLPADLREEYMHLYNNYRTQMRALRRYLHEEYKAELVKKTDKSHVAEEAREVAMLLQENDAWNEETKKLREARQEMKEREIEEQRLNDLILLEKKREEQREAANAIVRKEKERVQQFVTLENLDEEIEKALNSRTNYNFVIDKSGNRYIEMPDGSLQVQQPAEKSKDC